MLQHYGPQLVNLLAAVLLLLAFAMLSQRRILSLINLFAAQGAVLFLATLLVAFLTSQTHLYWSAGVTLALKVLLHREDAYEKESPRAGEADFIVAKHRNGPTATITVAFQGHYSRFVDMSPA